MAAKRGIAMETFMMLTILVVCFIIASIGKKTEIKNSGGDTDLLDSDHSPMKLKNEEEETWTQEQGDDRPLKLYYIINDREFKENKYSKYNIRQYKEYRTAIDYGTKKNQYIKTTEIDRSKTEKKYFNCIQVKFPNITNGHFKKTSSRFTGNGDLSVFYNPLTDNNDPSVFYNPTYPFMEPAAGELFPKAPEEYIKLQLIGIYGQTLELELPVDFPFNKGLTPTLLNINFLHIIDPYSLDSTYTYEARLTSERELPLQADETENDLLRAPKRNRRSENKRKNATRTETRHQDKRQDPEIQPPKQANDENAGLSMEAIADLMPAGKSGPDSPESMIINAREPLGGYASRARIPERESPREETRETKISERESPREELRETRISERESPRGETRETRISERESLRGETREMRISERESLRGETREMRISERERLRGETRETRISERESLREEPRETRISERESLRERSRGDGEQTERRRGGL